MKFCFWGNIASALNGTTIGGAELQISLLARSLVLAGHEVIVVDSHSTTSYITNEGIKIVCIPNWNKGLPVFRIFFNRIPALYKLFVNENADYYYVRMRSYFNLVAYKAAKKNNKKLLVALASDVDLLTLRDKYKYEYKGNFKLIKYFNQWLPGDLAFNYVLKRADYIIRQHSGQDITSHKVRGKSFIFPNILNHHLFPEKINGAGKTFIYVGSLTMLKGADTLLGLIKGADDSNIFMIVGRPNDIQAKEIYEQIKKLVNADVRGWKNHKETLELMTGIKALISTSEYEGFPNVFLEAWAMGIPVLSYKVNPGNVLEKYSFLGVCFNGDLKKMIDYINENKIPEADKEKMQAYIKEFHDFDTAGNRFFMALTRNNAQP